jgi:hypothetical protein
MPVRVPDPEVNGLVQWATNSLYPSRVHMTNGRGPISLCGFPVNSASRQRPDGLGICPDCATVFADLVFPLDTRRGSDPPPSEWFRQLPSLERRA